MVNTNQGNKTLFVAGCFDEKGGKPSKIAEQIFEAVNPANVDYRNGGSFQELAQLLENIRNYQIIFWFADVPNDKPKLVKEIKKRNNACVLVTSKRNRGEYDFQDLLYHALGIKSNLFVEFSKKENRYQGRVIDPLGNVFQDYNEDFGLVGKVLEKRANELLGYTRVSSKKVGDKIESPDKKEFFELIRMYGDLFHKLVHAHPEATNRFFGNASFREGDLIFVTRRNVDKRAIDKNSFIGVKQEIPVKYFGDDKPSIDTATQIKLYSLYQNTGFMLHSHAYIQNAPFTSRVIPCGALEEADEITMLFSDKQKVNFSVNLRGHGSLTLVDRVEHLRELSYTAREMPEIVKVD